MTSVLEYFVNYDKIPLSKRIGMSNVKDQTHRNMNKDEEFELEGRHINWQTGINIPDPETGLTPLMLASIHGRRDLVIALLERGAEVEYSEANNGRTALHFACKAGHADVVSELLKRGALVNAKDNHNKTPILIASKGGYSDVVKHLLPRGAGVNSTDDRGLSPLHYAAKFGHFEVLDILINHRGAIELRDNVEGFAPIHYAAQYGRKECVKCLLDYGGKVNRRSTKDKLTALMLASREGNKSIVSFLISRGADVSLYDIYGWAALHFAASWGRKDTAQILIVDGHANINQRCARADNNLTGTPPLCIAAKGSQVDVVKLLLHYGADINLSDIHTGHAALAYAAEAGMTFSVQTLIEYGAQLNRRSEVNGRTALMEAVRNGRHSCITKLLDALADLNILDFRMTSCWEIAVQSNHQEVLLGALLQSSRRAKVNALPWLQMHFHQLTDYHRWDEYHVHDEYDLLYDRTVNTAHQYDTDEETTLDEDEDEDGDGDGDDNEPGEMKEQRRREGVFEQARQRNKAQKRRKGSDPRGVTGGAGGVKRAGAATSLLPGTDRQQQQTKYLKRAFATAGQYLKAYLFGREGCFSGLFSLPGDCDVYLVYNLMMILSTCVQPQHVPEDIVIFQDILAKVGHMLVALFQADQTQQLPTMIDIFLMGKEPVETILPELLATTAFHDATRLLSSSFFFGPWAMFLESFAYDFETLWYHVTYQYGQPKAKYTHPSHGLWRSPVSNIFLQPRIKQMIHNVFHTWDKEHGLIVDGYGYYSEKAMYARYCPVTMYYLEGLGRALLVVAIIYYSADGSASQMGSYASYLYPPTSQVRQVVEAGQQHIQTMEWLLAGLVVSLGLYELGLIEEKRWSVSPAMVFRHETLEQFRWKMVYYHFADDPYKLLDGLALALGLTWLLCRYVVYGVPAATMPQNIGMNLLSAGTQALTLCLLPQVLGLARYLGTLFPEFGKVCFGIAFLVYDLWPYLLVYLLVSLALGSALAGILTMSPLSTFHYLLSFLFFGGSSGVLSSTSGVSSGSGSSGSLDEYINRAASSPEVNPVYTTILILMIVVCFPTTGIIFLSIIQRLFSRHQASSAPGGIGSGAAGAGGASSSTANPAEFQGYNAGPGSSPDDVIEKYYYYWHCRRVQEHSLVLEKSAWCMLPPPLNLCALFYYIPHVYLGWRARLRFDLDITVSWGGYVTDTVLFLLVLIPCALYEYFLKNVYGIHRIVTQNYETDRADMSPESNFGRLMGLLYLPFGTLYTMLCLVYKFAHDPCARLIIKTRLADGRCRMSRGMLRDIYEANVLARLEDFRLHGHWRFYASTHPQMNREYEYNAFEKKAIAASNLKMKPSSSAAAAAYAAMGGVVDAQKPFTSTNFALNVPKYTEEIYTHEFSEFQSSRASGKIRRGGAWDAEDDEEDGGGSSVTGGGGGGSVSFAQSTKFKERGGRYLQYDEEDRQRLQAIEDGLDADMERLVGTEYSRIPRSVTLWPGNDEANGGGGDGPSWWSSWVPFRRRYRPSDYVGRKIKIVPQRPYLQLRLLHTTLPESHPLNQPQPLPDNPNIAVPQHYSLDQVLSKMAKDLRLRKWKAHQEMLLRTKQVASRQNLFVGELDAASLIVTDGFEHEEDGGIGGGGGLMRNPLEGDEGEAEDYLFFGPGNGAGAEKKPPSSSSWSFASSSQPQQQRREHLMDRKEAKHPDHFRRPRLIFQSLVQQFRTTSSASARRADTDAGAAEESTPLDAITQRDISMYQPGIETERQWALLAYEHDLVTTHHAYASKRSAWQRARSQRAQQPGQSRFGWYGRQQQPPTSQAQARQSTHNRRGGGGGGNVGNDRSPSTTAWMGKDLSSVTHQGRRTNANTITDEGETDDRWLQQQSTWSLSPTLLEEQTHVLFQPTSLYFQPYHHPPLFTAREREAIFRPALPEYFPSDFARAMLDVDLNVTLLQEMLPWLLEKQVQAMDNRIQRRMDSHYQQLHQQQHHHLQAQQQQFYEQQQQQQQQNSFASSGMMMMLPMSGSINGGGMGMDDERRASFFSSSSRPRSPTADTLLTMTQDDSLYGGGGGTGGGGSFYGGGGGTAMRPMGEEESAYSRPATAASPQQPPVPGSAGGGSRLPMQQPSSMVVPGGQLYGDDDDEPSFLGPSAAAATAAAFVASAPTATTTATTAGGVSSNKRPVSSGRRSVSFYQEPSYASTIDGPETAVANGAPTAAPGTPTVTTNAVTPGSNPIASGGGRIRHDNVVNYMVASGKDPTRYTGNGAVWY